MKTRNIIKKSVMILIIVICLSSFCIAQEDVTSCADGGSCSTEYDPDNPESFDYLNGDYGTFPDDYNWEELDWGQTDYMQLLNTINCLDCAYDTQGFYENIPVGISETLDFNAVHFERVTWEDVPEDFHEALAKSQDGLNNYCKEMGNSCQLKVSSKGKAAERVKFSENGISIGSSNVPDIKNYPSGTQFDVKWGTIVITYPSDDEGKAVMPDPIPEGTNAIIDLPGKNKDFKFDNPNIPEDSSNPGANDVTVNGDYLTLKNGELVLAGGGDVTINGVDIHANKGEEVTLYGLTSGSKFNDEQDPNTIYNDMNKDNSIFFGSDTIITKRNCPKCHGSDYLETPFSITFNPDNPYVDVNNKGEEGYPNQKYDDKLSITPLDGGFIIQKGDDQPSVTAIGHGRMQNGNRELNFADGELFAKSDMRNNPTQYNSIGMNLDIQNKGRQAPANSRVTINDDNSINFGGASDLSYVSIDIDPSKYPDSAGVSVETNKLAEAKNLNMVVLGYVKPDDDTNVASNAADDYMDMLNKGEHPVVFDCSSPKTSSDIASCKALVEALDEEESLGGKVVGHSGITSHCEKKMFGGWECEPRTAVLIGVNDNGEEEYAYLENRPDLSLGCSVAEHDIQEIRRLMDVYLESGRDITQFEDDPVMEAIHNAYQNAAEQGVTSNTEQYVLKPALEELGYGSIYGDDNGRLTLEGGRISGGIPSRYLGAFAVISDYAKNNNYVLTMDEMLQRLSKNKGNKYRFPSCESAEQAVAMAKAMGKTYTYLC